MTTAYKLKVARFEHAAGTIVHEYVGFTFGLIRDDEAATGEPHIAVTLEDGETPFFTIPVADLEKLET